MSEMKRLYDEMMELKGLLLIQIEKTSPSTETGLFLAGLRSALIDLTSHIMGLEQHGRESSMSDNEIKARLSNIEAEISIMRRRVYCMAGEREKLEEYERVEDQTRVAREMAKEGAKDDGHQGPTE